MMVKLNRYIDSLKDCFSCDLKIARDSGNISRFEDIVKRIHSDINIFMDIKLGIIKNHNGRTSLTGDYTKDDRDASIFANYFVTELSMRVRLVNLFGEEFYTYFRKIENGTN